MLHLTNKQIAEMSDLAFAAALIQDRHDRLANPGSVMAQKMRRAIRTIEQVDCKMKERAGAEKPRNFWSIHFFDGSGRKLSPAEISCSELERVGEMVSEGYPNGGLTTTDLD